MLTPMLAGYRQCIFKEGARFKELHANCCWLLGEKV